jgi:hypothetical protein
MSYKPLLSKESYGKLPKTLLDMISIGVTDADRDLILMSTLGVLSGCLPSTVDVRDKFEYSNLYVVILAPAGAGKGRMSEARQVLGMFDDFKRARGLSDVGVIIPGNTSGAAMLKVLQVTKGAGVIFQTEVDTLTQANNQDWGGFSDILRMAFHHEPISAARQGEAGVLTIAEPKFSMVLSGTFEQLRPLIDSVANGLFSRVSFILVPQNFEWISLDPTKQPKQREEVEKVHKRIFELLVFNDEFPFQMSVSSEQWQVFDSHFKPELGAKGPLKGGALSPVVKRNAIMAVKVALILTSIRKVEDQSRENRYQLRDDDVATSIELSARLLENSDVVIDLLASLSYESSPPTDFLATLPDEFTRSEAVTTGGDLSLGESTVDQYLRKLVIAKFLTKPKAGTYRKVKPQ